MFSPFMMLLLSCAERMSRLSSGERRLAPTTKGLLPASVGRTRVLGEAVIHSVSRENYCHCNRTLRSLKTRTMKSGPNVTTAREKRERIIKVMTYLSKFLLSNSLKKEFRKIAYQRHIFKVILNICHCKLKIIAKAVHLENYKYCQLQPFLLES